MKMMDTPKLDGALRRRRRRGAFTLLELMVAMVIAGLILTVLIQVTGMAVDSWRLNQEKVRASRQAKMVLDHLARDFESIQLRGGNEFEWLYAGVDDELGGGAGKGAALAFFNGASDRYNGQVGTDGADRGGDVSGVAYRLIYKDPAKNDAGEFSVYGLYRNLVDPDKTFEELLGKSELVAGRGDGGAFRPYLDDAGAITNFISENIVGLSVSFVVEYEARQGRGGLVTKQKRLSVIDTDGDANFESLRIKGNGIAVSPEPDDAAEFAHGRIVGVDISISVITDGAMEVIRGGGLSGDELADLLSKNTYRYAKAVDLPQL